MLPLDHLNISDGYDHENRASQLKTILQNTTLQVTAFLQRADEERDLHRRVSPPPKTGKTATCLANPESSPSASLGDILKPQLAISEAGVGTEGLRTLIDTILQYSVNPSAPGFLDKLYAAPLPPGIAAELILGVLNTNVHVYQVSPVLTLIEKTVTKNLARLFGLNGARAGGINVQGGSASNLTSIVIARNTLFPGTKSLGNGAVCGRLLLFTSAHGHYSIEKAAQALGFGSCNVVSVPVDEDGRMIPSKLETLVSEAREKGDKPFYVNATAGTTVLGSFDPFEEIAAVARKYGLWMHVDAAWGGGFVFSNDKRIKASLHGIGLADSIATNPHKMLGVPLTCSFLLGNDLRQFQEANTLKAGYLFHDDDDSSIEHSISNNNLNDETAQNGQLNGSHIHQTDGESHSSDWQEPWDLADLSLQCGRRGDALKFYLSWRHLGTEGYTNMVDRAYQIACYMSQLVQAEPDLRPVLSPGNDPSCLQVCFYFTPAGRFTYGLLDEAAYVKTIPASTTASSNGEGSTEGLERQRRGKLNTRITAQIAKRLIPQGFMIDHAPALEGQEDRGHFFRVVVNISTIPETVKRLVELIIATGWMVVDELQTVDR